jgi:hypothetical protein
MTSIEKEFYSYLGLLATKFARVEQLVSLTCIHLKGSEQISEIEKIQKNGIHKNLHLLRTLSKLRKAEETAISAFIKSFMPLKWDRNRFIHSVWFKPYETDSSIQITCSDMRVVEEKSKSEKVTRYDSTHFTYDIEDIKHIISVVDDISTDQAEIYQRLKKLKFDDNI